MQNLEKGYPMPNLVEYSTTPPRILPVILLADVSGSMKVDGKIESLNSAIKQMLPDFAEESDNRVEIHVAVITFGNDKAELHLSLTPAKDVQWKQLCAQGRTPLGAALKLAKRVIEDDSVIPGTAYRPALILISDGIPTDEWKTPLKELLMSNRASKADRFAMAIGADADMNILNAFLDNNGQPVFKADEGSKIRRFFQWVTMSVSIRSQQIDPNSIVSVNLSEIKDELEY